MAIKRLIEGESATTATEYGDAAQCLGFTEVIIDAPHRASLIEMARLILVGILTALICGILIYTFFFI